MMKKCVKCGETKALDAYRKHHAYRHGVLSSCKDCEKKYFAERYKNNPEHVKKIVRNYRSKDRQKHSQKSLEWQKNNPLHGRAKSAKRRATIAGVGGVYEEFKRRYGYS